MKIQNVVPKVLKFVDEYEKQTGIDAQNFRQSISSPVEPNSLISALRSDIDWHIDNAHEIITPLERAMALLEQVE